MFNHKYLRRFASLSFSVFCFLAAAARAQERDPAHPANAGPNSAAPAEEKAEAGQQQKSAPATEAQSPAGSEQESAAGAEAKTRDGPAEEVDIATLLRQAIIANHRGEFKSAIDLCDQILKIKPYSVNALSTRGQALVSAGNYKQGLADINRVIGRVSNKQSLQILHGLRALAYLKLENFPRTVEACDIAIKMNPKEQQYWIIRAVAHRRASEYKKALSDIKHGLSLNPAGPNEAIFLSSRADIYSALGREEECLKDLNRVVELTPKDPIVWMDRARFYLKQKDWQKAVNDLDNVIDYAPMGNLSNEALKLRAQASKQCGKYKISIEDYTSLLSGYPDDLEFLFGRTEAEYMDGQFAAALKDISKCLKSKPADSGFLEMQTKINDGLKKSAPESAQKGAEH